MNREIVDLRCRKLSEALRSVDDQAESAIRHSWIGIGPDPKSPFVSVTMGAIQDACASGLLERERVGRETVLTTLTPFKDKLSAELAQVVMSRVDQAFPESKYVALVEGTPGVYRRSQASANKFNEGTYNIQLALIKVLAANSARRSVASIKLAVDELVLQAAVNRNPRWMSFLSAAWLLVAEPTLKWIFGIIAAVGAAVLLAFLGFKE